LKHAVQVHGEVSGVLRIVKRGRVRVKSESLTAARACPARCRDTRLLTPAAKVVASAPP
jgi:hypothetical protein